MAETHIQLHRRRDGRPVLYPLALLAVWVDSDESVMVRLVGEEKSLPIAESYETVCRLVGYWESKV